MNLSQTKRKMVNITKNSYEYNLLLLFTIRVKLHAIKMYN